jgi:hypothetical protein
MQPFVIGLVIGAAGRGHHLALAVGADDVVDDGAGFRDPDIAVGDDGRLAERMHRGQFGRRQPRRGVALVALHLVGHAQFFQQPQDTLRARVIEMMQSEHGVSSGFFAHGFIRALYRRHCEPTCPESRPTGSAERRHSGIVRQHQTPDVQLHIGESLDSGFDAPHRPGMTDWIALRSRYVSAIPRREAPGLCMNPSPIEGAGNAGRPMRPIAACAMIVVERTRVSQVTPESPGIPHAMVLTVSFALSPATGLFCHRRLRIAPQT